jgi:predicted nucleotidyltransferase
MGTEEHYEVESRGLFGQTRSALLAMLFGHADQSFYLRQLVRAVGAGHGALQRELKHLTEMGLIVRTVQGNQVLYRANSQSPIFSEIKTLISKTVGTHDVIRLALASLGAEIQIAFVYGSVARQQERADSDVDLMVLGDAPFSEVVSALSPAQKALGREINPTVFPVSEFRSKLVAGNHFLHSIMKEKKLFVLGTENELAKLASK